jgi:pimeloyl-ACP methyl ester carboxylesterase
MSSPHDATARASVNGIEIAYETFGDPADPAILLVMGLGTQMIAWPDEMCTTLAAAGHHVIRYDNRDVGLSTHLRTPPPSRKDMLLRRNAPYTIDDMANDGLGLLDHLGIERFHLVGASMGGFISQSIASRASQRVRSLTLLMTSTGSRRVGRPTPTVIRRMAAQVAPRSREQAMEEAVATYRIIGSPDHLDENLVRELAGIAYDRSHDPDGRMRQLAAILAQPDRTAELARLRMPTLIIHGLADPLVSASGGLALAKAIPGATFIGHSGMGHDLPRTRWPELTDEILRLVARTERAEATAAP